MDFSLGFSWSLHHSSEPVKCPHQGGGWRSDHWTLFVTGFGKRLSRRRKTTREDDQRKTRRRPTLSHQIRRPNQKERTPQIRLPRSLSLTKKSNDAMTHTKNPPSIPIRENIFPFHSRIPNENNWKRWRWMLIIPQFLSFLFTRLTPLSLSQNQVEEISSQTFLTNDTFFGFGF